MSTSKAATASEKIMIDRAVEIGYRIHRHVVDEGRAEGVFAYLYHDGKGKAWFEKYDRKSHQVRRTFSPMLAREIRLYVRELRIYARWVEVDGRMDEVLEYVRAGPPGSGSGSRKDKQLRKGRSERHQLTNEKRERKNYGEKQQNNECGQVRDRTWQGRG